MKKRVLSAIILILIAIPLIIEGEKAFALGIGILGIFALKEIIDLKKSHGSIPFIMTILFYIGFLCIVFSSPLKTVSNFTLNFPLMIFLSILFLVPTLFTSLKDSYTTSDAFYFLGMIFFLGIAFHNTILIRSLGIYYFIYVIIIPILTDTFAYFFGTLIGKHKVAPFISPNKSWEGCLLGTICSTLISCVFFTIFIGKISLFYLIPLTILFSIGGQIGDLFFSKIKRENNIKDYSDLIPGHGGILDRFDSLIFVAFIFMLLTKYV